MQGYIFSKISIFPPPPFFEKSFFFPMTFGNFYTGYFSMSYLHFPPWSFPRLDGEKKWQIPNFFPLILCYSTHSSPFLSFIFPLGHFKGLMGKKMADSKFFPLFHPFFPLCFLHFSPLAISKA